MSYKCAKCDWRGEDETAEEHARETGHLRCVVCERRSLTEFEPQVCEKCAERVRDDLTTIKNSYAHLERVIAEAAYRGILADALAVLGDGSTQGGGPDDDIRYHDPCSAAAQLERNERDWREEFSHGKPNYAPLGSGKWQSRRPSKVFAEAYTYLSTWHSLAVRTHPGFDDYAAEVADLRSRLEHMVGLANDPRRAPIPCVCGGKLQQHFGDTGLSDDRVCRECGTTYRPADYLWRYRMLTELQGWVSLDRAAAEAERPTATVWAWVCSLDVPSACHRLSKRVVVELDAVMERSDKTPRQVRRRSA